MLRESYRNLKCRSFLSIVSAAQSHPKVRNYAAGIFSGKSKHFALSLFVPPCLQNSPPFTLINRTINESFFWQPGYYF